MDRSRKVVLIGFDILCYVVIALLYFLSTLILERVMHYDLINYLINTSIMLASIILFRLIFKIYLSIWRYSNTATYLKMVLSDCIGALFALFLCRFTGLYTDVWVFVIVASLSCLMVLSSRFCYCLVYRRRKKMEDDGAHKIPVAIVGAGQLGAHLADELIFSKRASYKLLANCLIKCFCTNSLKYLFCDNH